MTDILDNLSAEEKKAYLADLKETATLLGISFSPNIGINALQDKIKAKQAETKSKPTTTIPVEENPIQIANRLVRCIVTSRSPLKKEYEGDVFAAGNSKIPTIRKYIHFGVPWHVPEIILNSLREKRYQEFYTERTDNGQKIKKARLVPEYIIEELPYLNPAELTKLANRQAVKSKF